MELVDSDIKRYEEIKKLTTGKGEDYTTGCLLDFEHIKNHYRSIAIDLSRQIDLNAGPKVIQQIELFGQLKKLYNTNGNAESMFFLTILEKNQRNKINIFSRKGNSILKMVNS